MCRSCERRGEKKGKHAIVKQMPDQGSYLMSHIPKIPSLYTSFHVPFRMIEQPLRPTLKSQVAAKQSLTKSPKILGSIKKKKKKKEEDTQREGTWSIKARTQWRNHRWLHFDLLSHCPRRKGAREGKRRQMSRAVGISTVVTWMESLPSPVSPEHRRTPGPCDGSPESPWTGRVPTSAI